MLFIDFKATYDTRFRNNLLIVEGQSITQELVRLVRCAFMEARCRVEIGNCSSPVQQCFSGYSKYIPEVDQGGAVFNKMTQILAYADGVVTIGRSLLSVKEAFL